MRTAPQRVTRVVVSPGERVEIVVPMAAGERTVLRSFPGGVGSGFPDSRFAGADDTFDILQLRAARSLHESPALPTTLSAEAPLTRRPARACVSLTLAASSR